MSDTVKIDESSVYLRLGNLFSEYKDKEMRYLEMRASTYASKKKRMPEGELEIVLEALDRFDNYERLTNYFYEVSETVS